MIAPDLRAKPW